jgi:cytochrome bd-type quinol oxidase subunit 2
MITGEVVTGDRHLELLSQLLMIAGMIAGLTAASLMALAIGAAVLMVAPQSAGVAASVAAGTLFLLTVLLLLFAGACVAAGRGLRRRDHWARPLALLLSLINLLIVPFGTVLGAYGFWVLLRERSRQLLGVV